MEPGQQQQVQTVSSVSGFWLLVIIGLAFVSGYMAAKSVVFSPSGFTSVAQLQLGGTLVSIVALILAFALHRRLVKVSSKRVP